MDKKERQNMKLVVGAGVGVLVAVILAPATWAGYLLYEWLGASWWNFAVAFCASLVVALVALLLLSALAVVGGGGTGD